MEFWNFFLTLALVSFVCVTTTALPISEEEDDSTDFPILHPPPASSQEYVSESDTEEGQNSQDTDEDATDFPILRPDTSDYEEYGIDRPRPIDESEDDTNTDDSPIPRPHPGQSDEYSETEQSEIADPRFFRLKRSPDHDGEENSEEYNGDYDDDYLVERPVPEGVSEESGEFSDEYTEGDTDTGFYEPEGNEMEVDDEVQILYPEAEARKKRAADNYDEEDVQPSIDGGDDDTVIIEAASCQELEKKCKETGDLFACGAHKENCSDNVNGIEDTQINDIINCAYAGKNGKHNGRCPQLASE